MQPPKFSKWVVVVLLLSTSTYACNYMAQNKPLILNWDLSRSLDIQNVGWSLERGDETFSRTDDMVMNLKLPNGKVLKEDIRFYVCERQNSRIDSIDLHLQKNTLEGAYRDAQRMIKLLNLPYKDLDKWYAGVKSGDNIKDVAFYSINNDSFPSVELNVRHSFNDEKPWFVLLHLYFPQKES